MHPVTTMFLTAVCLMGCSRTFDDLEHFDKFGVPNRIELFRHIDGQAFSHQDSAEFVITNENELETAFEEIRSADNPESWKGAGWDKLKIYFRDTTLVFNTNRMKIGKKASGAFYDLPKNNFIMKRTNGN